MKIKYILLTLALSILGSASYAENSFVFDIVVRKSAGDLNMDQKLIAKLGIEGAYRTGSYAYPAYPEYEIIEVPRTAAIGDSELQYRLLITESMIDQAKANAIKHFQLQRAGYSTSQVGVAPTHFSKLMSGERSIRLFVGPTPVGEILLSDLYRITQGFQNQMMIVDSEVVEVPEAEGEKISKTIRLQTSVYKLAIDQ